MNNKKLLEALKDLVFFVHETIKDTEMSKRLHQVIKEAEAEAHGK